MKWQSIRNENYRQHNTYCEGECSIFNENATLSICLSGKRICESDLQTTFKAHIKECSLLKKKNEKNTACMLSCTVFEEYKKSHEY